MRGKLILKLMFVPLLVLGVMSFSQSASALSTDKDHDSVANTVEMAAPNNGDNNYDGTPDKKQNVVASLPDPNDTQTPGAYVSLQVGESTPCAQVNEVSLDNITNENNCSYIDSAWKISKFEAATPPAPQPDGTVFPLGMFNIELKCGVRGQSYIGEDGKCYQYNTCYGEGDGYYPYPCDEYAPTANLKLIFDRVMDTSNWSMFKYNPLTGLYEDWSAKVTVATEVIGYERTTISWSITDGGDGDFDGVENGHISDPIGPGVVTQATTPATTVASTVAPATLAHTGSNLALYSIILGFLMVGSGLVIVRKS